MADLEKSDSDSHPENNLSWDLPSSSMSSGQDDPGKPHRKRYRSKSAVSTDPRSPYYTSQGFTIKDDAFKHGFTKAPSVSCVPRYDGHKYAEAASKSQLPFNGGIAGLNLSPDDPKAATIRQHYYPEGGWGYVVCVCAFLVEIISGGLQASFGLLILNVMSTFGKDATLVRTGE